MFTTAHFIWIAICLAFILIMTRFCLKKQIPLKAAGQMMVVICAFSEISKIMSGMTESPDGGMFLDPQSLPFHLCSLLLFSVIFITFGQDGPLKQSIIDFVAPLGTLGSICAILIPTNGTDFTTIEAYQCFIYHAGLLWFSLYLIFSGQAHLNLKALGRNLGILFFLTAIMIYINGALSAYGTNFMYVVRPPMEGLPYLNLNHGWYAYFLRLLALGVGLLSLFYLPFILRAVRLERAGHVRVVRTQVSHKTSQKQPNKKTAKKYSNDKNKKIREIPSLETRN